MDGVFLHGTPDVYKFICRRILSQEAIMLNGCSYDWEKSFLFSVIVAERTIALGELHYFMEFLKKNNK